MPRDSNLTRRGAVYYGRVFVPSDLQPAMGGKREIWRSLQTKDYPEAKRRKAAFVDEQLAIFDGMRRRRELTEDDIAAAVWDHYATGLDAGDRERASRPTQAEIASAEDRAIAQAQRAGVDTAIAAINAMTDVEILAGRATWAGSRRARRLAQLQSDLVTGDTRLIEPDADAFLSRHGFAIDSTERYRDLCLKLMRAEIEQLERYAERDRGDYTGKPADPIVVEPAIRTEALGQGGETIMGLFARYESDNPNRIRPESFAQARRDVHHFVDTVGPRVRPDKITKAHVRDWQAVLERWPVKATETAAFRERSIREVVEANERLPEPKPTLSRQTVRRYMSSLGGYCRWLTRKGYLDANPVTDMLPGKAPPTNKRSSFTDDQIVTLFSSPLFTGTEADRWSKLHKPGDVQVRDHRYWLPLIMAYSGARPAEIAQLDIADVKQVHGMWVLHITEEGGEGKRVKTRGSMRVVPVHSELIRLGLIKHRNRLAKAGATRLFPEVEIPEVGQIAGRFSREFNRYLSKIGIKQGRDLVLYSLRHTFIDRLRLAGFMDAEIGTIVGHDKPTMTGRYGTEQEGTLRRRAELVEAVRYCANQSEGV